MKSVKAQRPEIIVGIPSYLEADSIGFVTQQVDRGLQKYFSNYETLIVNVDNNSEDNTKEAFLAAPATTQKKYISTPPGVRGKGNNFFNLFKFCMAQTPDLRAVVVVDADLKSITPEWIKHLAEPVLKGYDYALPRYSRHQFDGTITNHICHPLLDGLVGANIRQPIGGEFAFSPALVKHWLEQKWLQSTRLYGIDIFMTLKALLGKFKICEVGLGAKIHKASSPKLGPMFTQVVTTFFEMILSHKSQWIDISPSDVRPKPLFGMKRLAPPQELAVDIRALKEQLRSEVMSREKLLKRYLSDYLFINFRRMVAHDHFEMNTLFWTQAVYQLLFAFDTGSRQVKNDIVEALKPLYFARSVTFDYETWKYRIDYAEEAIMEQSMAFASQKPYFYGLYLKRARRKGKGAICEAGDTALIGR
jgi:glycosyltransferase involved in cell wall biosynthesis